MFDSTLLKTGTSWIKKQTEIKSVRTTFFFFMKKEITKTHYNLDEYYLAIDAKFPNLSRWTTMQLEKHLGITELMAGCQPLYRANDLQKVLDWLELAKKEGRLIEKNGFLIALEFHA